MAWKPPIDRRSKRALLNDKRFFRLLAEECHFADKDTAFLVYIWVVKLVFQELRRFGVARLPHLGDFGLVEQKPRPGWIGKVHVRMGAKKVLRFYPKDRMKRYFRKYTGPE